MLCLRFVEACVINIIFGLDSIFSIFDFINFWF